jgi:hypothetical protein
MRQETLRVVEDLVFAANGDYGQLFDQTATFMNAELAKIYQVPAPAGGGFAKITLPADGPRAGLLTHPGFLAATSSDGETKPMVRGRVIRERLLCQKVPDPPKAETLPPPMAGLNATKRERLAVHRTEPACAGCHGLIDPPGLALENFDAIGAYRRTEPDGSVIDARGELDGVAFDGAKGLGQSLRTHRQVGACLTTLLYRVATSHREEPGELPAIARLAAEFDRQGRRVKPLLLAIVTSDAFTSFAPTAP